jgi:hypothetical protein
MKGTFRSCCCSVVIATGSRLPSGLIVDNCFVHLDVGREARLLSRLGREIFWVGCSSLGCCAVLGLGGFDDGLVVVG